jgi:mRNA interferase RelE/StbE
MDNYGIIFTRSARKELEMLAASVVSKLFPKIESLAENPRPRGCRKIQGEENLWRIRIGEYRIVYAVYDKKRVIDILAIRHRKDAFKKMR